MSVPWMPLDIDDYLADTRHLTTLEHGAYLLMIMRYWQKGGLPEDERLVARIAGLSEAEWAQSRDVLASFFDAGWQHKRIDAELMKAAEIISKRKSAASRMHANRKGDAHAEQVHSTCSDTRVPPKPSTNISDTDVSGAEAPLPHAYTDNRHELWGEGKPILLSLGIPERQCGQLIGRWLKATGDDCAGVLDAIQRAREARPHEPIPWITRALPTKANRNDRNHDNRPNRRPSGTDQAISALADAVARRTGGGVPPDDPGGFRFDRGPEDDSGNAGGAAGAAPRLGFGG